MHVNTEKVVYNNFVGRRIDELRDMYGFSIYRIAEESCVRHTQIKKIIAGQSPQVSLRTLAKISDVFSLPLREFFNYGDPDPSTDEILRILGKMSKKQKKLLLEFLDTLR